MKKKLNYADIIKETVILTVAVAIIAAAVYFFLVPSHASVSSISGLGIVLSNFVPLPLSAITMILNVVLLIIGFLTCGREFGAKTVYTSILLPLFLAAAEHSAKPQTEAHDKMPKGMVTPGFKSIFEDILREGQLAGEIRDDAPADLIAEMFHSVYQAAAFSKLPIGFQENVALKTRLLLAGIRKA